MSIIIVVRLFNYLLVLFNVWYCKCIDSIREFLEYDLIFEKYSIADVMLNNFCLCWKVLYSPNLQHECFIICTFERFNTGLRYSAIGPTGLIHKRITTSLTSPQSKPKTISSISLITSECKTTYM